MTVSVGKEKDWTPVLGSLWLMPESHGISPALGIDHDAAVADPSGTVRRMAEYVDLPVTAAAASFIPLKLRRHQQATSSLRSVTTIKDSPH